MSRYMRGFLWSFIFLFFFTCSVFSRDKDAFLIKGAKIYTLGKQGLLTNAALFIEGGRIKKIIQDGVLPSVPVEDYSSKYIIPGLVDAHTYISGYERLLENTEIITSDLITYPAFDPLHLEVKEALCSGITTVNFVPRSENLVGGISSIFKTTRGIGDLLFLKKEAFLKISFNAEVARDDRAPTSLMGAAKILSQKMHTIAGENERKREGIFQDQGIRKLLKGRIQPLIAASTFEEINTALQWFYKWNMKGVIVGGEEAHRLSNDLREKEIHVLLSPLLFSLPERMPKNAASLLKNNVKVAFISNTPEGEPLGLRISALLLYHQGISQEEALKTITLFPAQILGVVDSVGSIEEGKDADFVVFSGEPLDLSSRIEAVYSNGRAVFIDKK
ncbi:MAG: amidohydrolase family protein [Candidatus Aminicenantes bacterium]|nr:MAG: amidohydrolase family protein [Candidatus Aminicenantes bacterium]